jgi:DNA-binding response OmpR family regulator
MTLANTTIVAIDDTHSILTFLRISLEAYGVTFHGALTAAGGVALCESTQPDLVILDLTLPDREGLKILPRIKRLNKERNLPVVVLTAHKEKKILSEALELGANAYVIKPFVLEDLLNIIQEQLNRHHDQDKSLAPIKATASVPTREPAKA